VGQIQHTADFVDIQPFLEIDKLPQVPMKLDSAAVWHVRATPLDFVNENHSPQDWYIVRGKTGGDLFRIPLCPYRTFSTDLAELALSTYDLGQRYAVRYPNARRVHVVMGRPIEDRRPHENALRYWIGCAVQIH